MLEVIDQLSDIPTRQEIESHTLAVPHIAEVANSFSVELEDAQLSLPYTGLGRFYLSQGDYTQSSF